MPNKKPAAKATPRKSKNSVHVAVILDESGSMESCRQQTIDGFNTYIDGLRKDKESKYVVTLTKFDSFFNEPTCREFFANVDIKDAKPLSADTYAPRGNTPMYDAIGQTINKIDSGIADKVIVVVITDGQENASREFNGDSVKKLIAQKEKSGNWTFVYLGANQNAWDEARAMGIQTNNAATFSTANMANVMRSMAADTVSYARSEQLRSSTFMTSSPSVTMSTVGGNTCYTYGDISTSGDISTATNSTAAQLLGSLGGKKRSSSMTPEQLREAAVKAAKARWSNNK